MVNTCEKVLTNKELQMVSGGMIWRPTSASTAKDRRDFIVNFGRGLIGI
ncbi:unnamed protein product [Fructobacillus fructosus]|nr:unnamed protein product [Fructobacillus fructosus]CAK1236957.1 unnamed protein product [Fructobacillus fructosus]CAK1238224.1 unnamed protein product [Fructobacillus fructosus]